MILKELNFKTMSKIINFSPEYDDDVPRQPQVDLPETIIKPVAWDEIQMLFPAAAFSLDQLRQAVADTYRKSGSPLSLPTQEDLDWLVAQGELAKDKDNKYHLRSAA